MADNDPIDPPPRLTPEQRKRLREASFRATRVYPGPVGEWLSKELFSWEEFGWRLSPYGFVNRIVEDIMSRPDPEPSAPHVPAQYPVTQTRYPGAFAA
jgi:hypothetical protein